MQDSHRTKEAVSFVASPVTQNDNAPTDGPPSRTTQTPRWADSQKVLSRLVIGHKRIEYPPFVTRTDAGTPRSAGTVSYTHLTLPTICSV